MYSMSWLSGLMGLGATVSRYGALLSFGAGVLWFAITFFGGRVVQMFLPRDAKCVTDRGATISCSKYTDDFNNFALVPFGWCLAVAAGLFALFVTLYVIDRGLEKVFK